MVRTLLMGAIAIMALTTTASAAPGTEYLSDTPDLIEYSRQAWGVLSPDTATHAPGIEPAKMRIHNKDYSKGLGSHAPAEIVVNLNGQYALFEAEVGVQWQSGAVGSVGFEAYVDGKKVFDSGVMREKDDPKPVKINVQGAAELSLVMTDGGDGITCDAANWAEARLTRSSHPLAPSVLERVDVAPFARIMAWDPARMDGVKANRLQEFPEEDLFLGVDIIPSSAGRYVAKTYPSGERCIGLEWLERRKLATVELQFLDGPAPSPDSVRVEHWLMTATGGSPGGSSWQGQWIPTKGRIVKDGNTLRMELAVKDNPALQIGVLKVRWILSPSAGAADAIRPRAFTRSHWKTANVSLQTEKPMPGKSAKVTIYNGVTVGSDGPTTLTWDLSKPLPLEIKYADTRRWKADRAVIRLELPAGSIGVAVDDIVNNGCVYAKDFGLFATTEPAKRTLAEYKRSIASRKTILESVRSMPDQTFERAVATVHLPPQDLGPTMLSLACDNRKFVVERGGGIYFDDSPSVYNYVDYQWGKPYTCRIDPVFGSGKAAVSDRRLQDDWMPIPVTTIKDGGITYRQRSFVAPYGRDTLPGDAPWLGYRPLGVVEYTIENTGSRSATGALRLVFTQDVDTAKRAEVKRTAAGFTIEKAGKLLGLLVCPISATCESADGAVTISLPLKASASERVALYMPRWDSATASELPTTTAVEPLVTATEAHWKRALAPAMQIEIPDKLLSDVIVASQAHIMLAARNSEGSRVAPWIGSINYGPLESEGHSPVRGMEFIGQTEFAKRALEYYISKYNKEGFLTTGYTIVGTGWHLWTLSEYYALTRDKEWLKGIAPEVARVCKWIMAQREKTKKLDSSGRRVPEYGLMPPGAMADWEVFAPYFYSNGNFYAGLNGAAHALADIGYPGADEMIANAEDFRREIVRAFHEVQGLAPVFGLRNGEWVPEYPTHRFAPMPVDDLYPGEDFGRSWCYDVEIGAHHLVPQGVLDPDSQDVKWMMDHMEDVQFMHAGHLAYPAEQVKKDWFDLGGFAKVQPYYARTVEVYALQDDVKPFIRSYFNTLPSLLNKEDLSLWEHFNAAGAWNKTHETGYFLHQTRTMLLTERGDDLWLAPFVTNNWLKDGMTVGVSKAPTRFGEAAYRITSHVNEGHIDATIDPPTRNAPKAIVLRLRHPEGKRIKAVTVDGKPHTDFDPANDTIRIAPSGGRIDVRAEY